MQFVEARCALPILQSLPSSVQIHGEEIHRQVESMPLFNTCNLTYLNLTNYLPCFNATV